MEDNMQGSYLGAIVGWRGTFFSLVPVALLTLAWQWVALPTMKTEVHAPSLGNVFRVLKNRTVAYGMAGCGAFFMGQFALFTYLRPFLETVTHVNVSTLSLLLLVIGAAGFIGTLAIGALLQRGLYGPLITVPIVMSAIAVALIPLGTWVLPVTVLLGVWGLIATATSVGWWNWIAQTMPHDAEAGGGLMVAVIQFAIALGSTVGGLLFDASGYRGTFLASGFVLLISPILTLQASRAQSCQ